MSNQITISLSKFDAAIFDMDGTLMDNMDYHKDAWIQFAKQNGHALTDKEFKEQFSGKRNDQIMHQVFQKHITAKQINAYTGEKESIYRELYKSDVKEIKGLTPFLKNLKKHHLALGIGTTAPPKNREFCLKALNLRDTFSVVLGEEHAKYGKPNPEIYLNVAKELGIPPLRCLVFEDSPPGVTAGKKAHMTVVGLLTTHTKDDLAEADYCINDYTQITLQD